MALAFDRSGNGPVLLLLHPLGADRRVWDPVVELLSAHREVIALDLPGFGQSPPLATGHPTPRGLAAAVGRELAAIGGSARTWPATRSGVGSRSSSACRAQHDRWRRSPPPGCGPSR